MDSVESLREEVSTLREQIISLQCQLEVKNGQLRTFVRNQPPFTPRKEFTLVELRPSTPISPTMKGKRDLGSMVEQVLDGGKKRRVGGWGIPFDPEGVRGKGVVVGIKVGSVLWETGIGGVKLGLEEEGFVVCEGAKWLVDEKERKRRVDMGKMSSTVVAFVRGLEEGRGLMKRGLWLDGRWHSVRRFEAVQPKGRKSGWVFVERRLEEALKGGPEFNRLERKMDGVVKGMERTLDELDGRAKRDRIVEEERLWGERQEGIKAREVREKEKVKTRARFGSGGFSFARPTEKGFSGFGKLEDRGNGFTGFGKVEEKEESDKRWRCLACGGFWRQEERPSCEGCVHASKVVREWS